MITTISHAFVSNLLKIIVRMRMKVLVFTAGLLFCVFIFSESSARRFTGSSRNTDVIVSQKSDFSVENGTRAALSFLFLVFAIHGFQKFVRRKKTPTPARRIVDQVEKFQNGVVRRVIIPAK